MAKYIYIVYILYVYVSNQIQQNKMQPEHVSEAERFNIPLCVCAPLKANAPLMIRSRSPVNRIHGRKFHLTVGGDNKYKISHEQFLKGTQIIQSNCTYKDMSPQ